jgi:CRISPR system Cascade subunit CasB
VTQKDKKLRAEAFVDDVIKRLKKHDTAFGAALRRADNPATERQSWEYLCRWCDITKKWECKPYALIGAALAKAKPEVNGHLGIGRAIARCYPDEKEFNDNKQSAATIKLRRLLACDTTEEACVILRSLLSLIEARRLSHNIQLDYADLLKDLLHSNEWFNNRVKAKWAMDFYRKKEEE